MTNHEKLESITGHDEPVQEEAVKMLLARIWDDYENEEFETNFDKYFDLYKGMHAWLNSPAPEDIEHEKAGCAF